MDYRVLIERQKVIRSELQRLENDNTSTEDESGDLRDSLIAEYERLDDQLKPIVARLEKINVIASAGGSSDNIETSDDAATSDGSDAVTRTRFGNSPRTRTHLDPFNNLAAVRSNVVQRSELVSRGLDAIEQNEHRGNMSHDYAEAATMRVQGNPSMGKHVLLTGSQDYQDAWEQYMRTGDNGYATRALTLATGSAGYMLPFVLDPTIVLTNSGSSNPYRRIASVKQTTSNTWNGVNSAGVNAQWLAEAAGAADASPSLAQIQITPQKAAAWVFGSYEVLDDSDFGAQLPRLLADAKDRLEEAAFATGTASGTPNGVFAKGATGQTAAATAYAVGDVYATQAALGPRFRGSPSCAWVGNIFYLNKTRQFDTYGGSSFWTNLGADTPEQLLGKPVYESTSAATGTASGTKILCFGDFSQFYIVDRVGVSMLYEPMVKAAATANIPTGQGGWLKAKKFAWAV